MDISAGTDNSKRPIVTHVTEVKISLDPEVNILEKISRANDPVSPQLVRKAGTDIAEHHSRVADMMELLGGLGFSFRVSKHAVHCYSDEIEAGDIKRRLIAAGFRDREFQIVLEYTRGWGML